MATREHRHISHASDGAESLADDYGVPGEPAWPETDWREHLRTTELLGSRVNYVDLGQGPPVLFVHGLSGCWQNWLENMPYFAQRHRVVALDLPGFGRSPMPSEKVTIPFYGQFVNAFLDRLEIPSASVIGNSLGGFVAVDLAINHPSRVNRLALVSAAGVAELPRRATPSQMMRAARWTQPLTNATLKRADFLVRRPRGRRALLGMVCRYPEKLTPQMCVEMLLGAGKPAFAPALESALTYDLKYRLGEILAPTLIVWGRNDMVVPVSSAHRYEKLLVSAKSEKVILDRTGHVAMIERPRTFNRLVDEFVGS